MDEEKNDRARDKEKGEDRHQADRVVTPPPPQTIDPSAAPDKQSSTKNGEGKPADEGKTEKKKNKTESK